MVVMEEAVVEEAAASEDVNLVELMNARARSYGMLARLFREEVDLPTLRELQKMRFPQATGNAAADEGYHQLYDYLKRAWDDSVTELAIDYVSTFIGHGVNGIPPPIRTSRCTRPSAVCSCRRPAPRCSPRCAKTS